MCWTATSRWGDTHHPALSETGGQYDGEWLFINDKAQSRVAVIDLRDFETKQIIKNPIAMNDHGGTFVTPNTDWVIEGGQYAAPLGGAYAPISEYNEEYRGMVTFWKFDRAAGRIDPAQSFAMELPPYWQDLCDAGKLVSDGWIFCNSFNTERATGGFGAVEGAVPFESGASQNDMDYMHVIDLNKAAEIALTNTNRVNDFNVIPMQTAIDEGLLYFVPEPKSPHGVDVAPKGDFLVISGKLDPHVTIFSFEKIQKAIADENWTPDAYGIPVLDFDSVLEAQVELGLGPLHTQFDNQGYAYTSLYLDSAVARWTLGGALCPRGPGLAAHRQGIGPLQRGPHRRGRGRHGGAGGRLPGQPEQVVGGSLRQRGAAAAPELPAHRHQRRRREPATALRYANGHRRAPLRPDHEGGAAQVHSGLSRSGLGSPGLGRGPQCAQAG